MHFLLKFTMFLFYPRDVSVTSWCSVKRGINGLIYFFGLEAFLTSPTLCFKEIQATTKIRVLPSGTFS